MGVDSWGHIGRSVMLLTWSNNSFCAAALRWNNAHIYVCTVRIRNVRLCEPNSCEIYYFHWFWPAFMSQQGTNSPCYSSSSIPVVGLIVTARLMPPNKFRALFQVSRLRPFSRGETIYQSPRCLWQPNRRRSSSSRLNECLCECMSVLASLMSRLRLNKFDFHLHRKSQLANGASNTEKAPWHNCLIVCISL